MLSVFWIIMFLLGLCLSYPLFLLVVSKNNYEKEIRHEQIDGVSVILFSYNNVQYLEEKIKQILKELESFSSSELIIIDNESTDGSTNILDKYGNYDNVKLQYNCKRKSVACSINIGITVACFEYIIFSDLRQKFSEGILKEMITSLQYRNVGAVSACLSAKDKTGRISILRSIENRIKKLESKNGNLIGVYGPLYAIRKSCYHPIPDHIILEDLYLTLSVLKSHKVILKENCLILDDSFSDVYNYKRVNRYYIGLLQLAKEKGLIGNLSLIQIIMLIWHKYFRLLLPVFSISLIIIICIYYNSIATLFSVILFTILILVTPIFIDVQKKIKEIIVINLYYLGAFFHIMLSPIYRIFRH